MKRACRQCGSSFVPTPNARGNYPVVCSDACRMIGYRKGNAAPRHPGPCDDCGTPTTNGRNMHGRRCTPCRAARQRAYNSAKNSRRRKVATGQFADVTTEYVHGLRLRTRRCPMPGCGVRLNNRPLQGNSKELDHIIPIAMGGTHTIGNVRIICRSCNRARPRDGRDFAGQPTLWAQAS